jgi:hypothetical protein
MMLRPQAFDRSVVTVTVDLSAATATYRLSPLTRDPGLCRLFPCCTEPAESTASRLGLLFRRGVESGTAHFRKQLCSPFGPSALAPAAAPRQPSAVAPASSHNYCRPSPWSLSLGGLTAFDVIARGAHPAGPQPGVSGQKQRLRHGRLAHMLRLLGFVRVSSVNASGSFIPHKNSPLPDYR